MEMEIIAVLAGSESASPWRARTSHAGCGLQAANLSDRRVAAIADEQSRRGRASREWHVWTRRCLFWRMLGSQDRERCTDDGVQARAWHRCRCCAISESVLATRSYRPYRLPGRVATSAEGCDGGRRDKYSSGRGACECTTNVCRWIQTLGACGCGDVDVMGSASAADCSCGPAKGEL